MKFNRLTWLVLLVKLLGASSLYRLPCSYAESWQEKKRCACTSCAWYKTVDESCVPPDLVCQPKELSIASEADKELCQTTVNSKGGMFGYCRRNDLIDNYEECCKLDWGFRIPLIFLILIIDFFLFNWWFNRFKFLLKCLLPTIADIVQEAMRYILESGGEEEEEEEEE